jgi:uncharacterized membrane protein
MIKENNNMGNKVSANNYSLFAKENYMIMLAGLAVITVGFLLMTGGKSADPKMFDKDAVYSTTRITVAPLVIIIGFIIEIVGILKQPKAINN